MPYMIYLTLVLSFLFTCLTQAHEDPPVLEELPILEVEVEEIPQPPSDDDDEQGPATNGPAAFMAIGSSYPFAGAFGNITGGGKKRILRKLGATGPSEAAVTAGLVFLQRAMNSKGTLDASATDTAVNRCQLITHLKYH